MALDSGGFVAAALYGQHRWVARDYLEFASSVPVTWAASMDLCCEPELAGLRVWWSRERIVQTVRNHNELERLNTEEGYAVPLMPCLQGWNPEDYLRCYDLLGAPTGLLGLGSVCRRPLYGAAGLIPILETLDAELPASVQLHLFGVKSTALKEITLAYPGRIGSTDSQAWDLAASRDLYAVGQPKSQRNRAPYLRRWYRQQQGAIAEGLRLRRTVGRQRQRALELVSPVPPPELETDSERWERIHDQVLAEFEELAVDGEADFAIRHLYDAICERYADESDPA